jgi:NAD(P)-dependent dehydrogenase (short-subunit alcohol dehydrogenase family)
MNNEQSGPKEKNMKKPVVIITGSSSGIDRETAYRFAQAGAKLVLSYNGGKQEVKRPKGVVKSSVLKKYDRVDHLENLS